ncbi:hypothetical protein BE1S18E01_27120 [Acinetobacter sp. BEC1-S18-ESBL-01]|uniref:Uncharacterized protein n=1 Tax=Acinetobacter pittii TaxID=48296 RepID=A0AB37TE45_ACIPI|nr:MULTISPECIES: hypothetical protein [Acinetobacter]QNB03127.1 hypothetical protein H2Q98_18075 [Acinetobacter baumannii]KQD32209.1 hypothetical protein APD13_14930 [Acinetobacter pittii]MCK0916125.1 hypothetical protein [Acinetobacter pittii]MCU4444031.1 hypothetical protein [Acinetobacter pittii]MCY3237218.1 hypothetical protein [Acinetobacter pittii]
MKLVRLETTRQFDGSLKLQFNDDGITPSYPNSINDSGVDLASGKVSENSIYYHHLDRNDTRYLIYIKGYLGKLDGSEIPNLEKALDTHLESQNN